jgi:hypothetical protein
VCFPSLSLSISRNRILNLSLFFFSVSVNQPLFELTSCSTLSLCIPVSLSLFRSLPDVSLQQRTQESELDLAKEELSERSRIQDELEREREHNASLHESQTKVLCLLFGLSISHSLFLTHSHDLSRVVSLSILELASFVSIYPSFSLVLVLALAFFLLIHTLVGMHTLFSLTHTHKPVSTCVVWV